MQHGSVGEVLVTSLTPEYPLIRFSTGDLSAFLDGKSSCGRTNQRIKGWLGRADQATKVRGMFVHPTQIEEIIRQHNEIGAARIVVSRDAQGNDDMVLNIEAHIPIGDPARISATLHAVTRLRGRVVQVATGSLPKDGILVADARKYD